MHHLRSLNTCIHSYSTALWCNTQRAPVIDFLIAQRRPTPNVLLLIIKHLSCLGLRVNFQHVRRQLDNSRICQLTECQLMDWTSRGLVNLWTGQLTVSCTGYAAGSSTCCFNCMIRLCGHIIQLTKPLSTHTRKHQTKTKHAKWPVGSASCPVRDLSSPQVV